MPRESYDVRTLRLKATSSLRSGISAFNGLDEVGRVTSVLLHLQHAFEMLLKAALLAVGDKNVFDKRKRLAISLEGSVRRCQQQETIKLTESEAGTIRVLDNLRDGEQHWHQIVDEGMVYLHARAAVTLFDDLLYRVWNQRLADHLPLRVLPISAEPPQSLELLVDREYSRISDLLRPGRKASAEAKARIRTLLATEALSDADAVETSESDINRVARGIRGGLTRTQVFPKLEGVSSTTAGEGLTVEVRFVKDDGLPVTFSVAPGAEAAAIRQVDLEKKFYMGKYDLADKSGVNRSRATALRRHLGLDNNDDHFSHLFRLGSQETLRYSDNSLRAMKSAGDLVDMDKIWAAHRPISSNSKSRRLTCDQPGCALTG